MSAKLAIRNQTLTSRSWMSGFLEADPQHRHPTTERLHPSASGAPGLPDAASMRPELFAPDNPAQRREILASRAMLQ